MSRPAPQPAVHELVDHLFRHRAGQMVATLTRIFGLARLELAEDVVQDALVRALRLWPYRGVPDNPGGWIVKVAKNLALDRLRRQGRWRDKQAALERIVPDGEGGGEEAAALFAREVRDDQLRLIFTCCHPALPRDSAVALTLKTVGGFSVAELARAFLTREPTMAQRLVRAKARLRRAHVKLEMPQPENLPARLDPVLEVLYLLFNEGYAASEGDSLVRHALCREAIRLCRLLVDHPETDLPKTHALAALMHFQASRLATRVDADGELLLLSEQDRSRWDRSMIARALRHLERAGSGTELTGYHLEAEIASCHALAADEAATDWSRILGCYDALLELNPSPVVALNRVVALARVAGPEAALPELARLEDEPVLQGYFPLHAVRGELLSRLDRRPEAAASYRRALERATSAPVRRFLERRLRETTLRGLG